MLKTFIIHVSKGYEERRQHIDNHLPSVGLHQYEFMLRGDINDLTEEIRNKFFAGSLSLPAKSCFYKHYLVMKEVVQRQIPSVLVLEDDVILPSSFTRDLQPILAELENERNYVVNIEEASSQVPITVRKKGKHLYLCNKNKLTGGLIYDLEFAKKAVKFIESTPQIYTADHWYNEHRHDLKFNLFWSHPTLVKQGSKNGLFSSGISNKQRGYTPAIRAWFRDRYKKYILCNLRQRNINCFKNVPYYTE
ncbi:glycosyltransferase family 25 protein [Vibrio salilacus]|uniref:glycosyltransferase family 25 protein n=1 Tax=Vibrio salilacus TaxID=1323749 RepID=UPI000C29F870|nr:glycosyltransferase family 25 protein [Vibrio salilacus]